MKRDELIKLAKQDPKIVASIMELVKQAAPEGSQVPTQFNETVPASGAPEAAPAPEAALAEAPVAEAPVAEASGPAEEGAKAAQTFLAPAFEAAAQGDPNAQKTLAVAAGEVAKGDRKSVV